jgi:hypothetical protein
MLDAAYGVFVKEMAETLKQSHDVVGDLQVCVRKRGAGLIMSIKVYSNGKLLDGVTDEYLGHLTPEIVTDGKPRKLKRLEEI